MIVLNDITKLYGGLNEFREIRSVRLKKDEGELILEHLGFGPTAEHSIRVLKRNNFGVIEPEMHFEWRGGVWLPYYFNNPPTDSELFLYRFNTAREVLRVDLWAGSRMIEIAGLLDLALWAQGFVEAAEASLYHPLFPVNGGAA